ncbi:CLUMA_CG018609, isoform A [Clunio marinus]|uniref:CLUMA_CG018609, isoform A n=1 Tax=Clunio marinus TaxID=568069 RepID=A0A1J1IXU2_9DIPT|nr:CLUMA_CG018609, isoform A [Clunio marinus]
MAFGEFYLILAQIRHNEQTLTFTITSIYSQLAPSIRRYNFEPEFNRVSDANLNNCFTASLKWELFETLRP